MNKRTLLIVCFIGAAALITIFYLQQRQNTITLNYSVDELQQSMEDNFPLTREELLFELILDEPAVALSEDGQHMSIGLTLDVRVFGEDGVKGDVMLDGLLRFGPQKARLMLADPVIADISLNDVPNLLAKQIEALLSVLLEESLNDVTLVQLNQDDYQLPLDEMVMASSQVVDGQVSIVLQRVD